MPTRRQRTRASAGSVLMKPLPEVGTIVVPVSQNMRARLVSCSGELRGLWYRQGGTGRNTTTLGCCCEKAERGEQGEMLRRLEHGRFTCAEAQHRHICDASARAHSARNAQPVVFATDSKMNWARAFTPFAVRWTRSAEYILRFDAAGVAAQSIIEHAMSVVHQEDAAALYRPGLFDEVSFFTLTRNTLRSPTRERSSLRFCVTCSGVKSPASFVPRAMTRTSGRAPSSARFFTTSSPSRRHFLADGLGRMTRRPDASRHCQPYRRAREPTPSTVTGMPASLNGFAYECREAETRLSPMMPTDCTAGVAVAGGVELTNGSAKAQESMSEQITASFRMHSRCVLQWGWARADGSLFSLS